MIEFTEIEEELEKTGSTAMDYLAPEIGKAYVVAIVRDGCSACEKLKPGLSSLETAMTEKHGEKIVFAQVHVKFLESSGEESLRCKDVFGHYFYPTVVIMLRTSDRGAFEYYRNVSPNVEELRENVEAAVEVATMIEKEGI